MMVSWCTGARCLGDMALHSADIDLLALEDFIHAQLRTGIGRRSSCQVIRVL